MLFRFALSRPSIQTISLLSRSSHIKKRLCNNMATPARAQPPWKTPASKSGEPAKLRVYNSLTRTKNDFVPVTENEVKWYSCGPTVYDDAHLGHARNYLTIDILRRILADYFGYKLKFVQNITDIDDKIILRGRQQHLFSRFRAENPTVTEESIKVTLDAFDAYVKKNLPLLNQELTPENFNKESSEKYANVISGKSLDGDSPPGDKEAKIKMHLRTAGTAATVLLSPSKSTPQDIEDFYAGAEDVLLPYLDSLQGSDIDAEDHSIFLQLTRKFENRFNEDMASLNVLLPDVVTRVTEYGPQIVSFVGKIVSKGWAYETDGSVYFDISAFEKTPENVYARLEPWNRNDKSLQADGEGALTQTNSGKRSEADFALWKKSKPGEPAWPSPWGPGRPGWHIECSVMASEVLGEQMDIHSGGIDLCFPHHDNELAQSEAFWRNTDSPSGHQWVNYFLHMGHLSISGSKMSKSLKNFTTIRTALARGDWDARSLRIIFLLGGWHDGVEITDDLRKAGASFETYVNNFFYKIRDLEVHPANSSGAEDEKVQKAFDAAKDRLHNALADSFDTKSAMQAISGLITDYNSSAGGLSDSLSMEIAKWVTRMVRIFGLDGTADPNDGRIGWLGTDIPQEAKPFVYTVSAERDAVRQHAIAGDLSPDLLTSIISKDHASKQQSAAAIPYAEVLSTFQEDLQSLANNQAPAKDFLALCDKLRDLSLWDLGIYLEDRGDSAPAMVRPVDAELRAAREQKEAIARQKLEAKQKREREEAEKKAKLAEQAKIDPKQMFRTEEFGAWDEDGVPTKDREGVDVPKSRVKKMRKEWEKQKKLHEEFLKSGGKV